MLPWLLSGQIKNPLGAIREVFKPTPDLSITREPVWPSGKAGKQRDLGSNPLRLSVLFKSCGLWTLSCDFVSHNYDTL